MKNATSLILFLVICIHLKAQTKEKAQIQNRDKNSALQIEQSFDLSTWQDVEIGLGLTQGRIPLHAVTVLDSSKFILSNVAYNGLLDPNSLGGNLVIREFDLKTNFKGMPKIISSNLVGFVRSNMGPALTVNCTQKAIQSLKLSTNKSFRKDSIIKSKSVKITRPIEKKSHHNGKVNFLVFDELGNFAQDGSVKLTRLFSCTEEQIKTKTVLVDHGKKPSIAIGKTILGEDRILIVYSSNGPDYKLMGRFFDSSSKSLGQAFVITQYSGEYKGYDTFSTDVIWNPRSRRFIVGFMIRERASDIGGCAILNVSVFLDGTATIPIRRGRCDAGGGHSIWVDIDRREWTNPNGIYAWYYESILGKNIYLMDKFGNPTGNSVWFHNPLEPLAQTMNYAPPFAALRDFKSKTIKLTQERVIPVLNGNFKGNYITALKHYGSSEHDHEPRNLNIVTFSNSGKLNFHRTPQKFGYGENWLLGIASLYEHTIYINGIRLQDETLMRLTVRPNYDPMKMFKD